jgi:hypothetical protein
MQVSFLWSVAPIPLVLLWATWLRAPDWVSESTRWRARLRAAAAILAPAVALVIAVPVHRVQQIPFVDPGFDPEEYLSETTPEARETAALFRRSSERYIEVDRTEPDEEAEFSGRAPTRAELNWLEVNAYSLALTLEASRRPTCNSDDPSMMPARWQRYEYGMISLILISGRQLEAEGKLDEALDRYFAALRVFVFWKDYRLMYAVDRVFSEFASWATQKGQTGELIGAAIKKLQAVDPSVLRLEDRVKADYIVARRAVFGDVEAWLALTGQSKADDQIMERVLWAKLMPWEKRRGLRLLNMLTETAVDRLHQMRDALAGGLGVVDFLAPTQNWNPLLDFEVKYDYLYRQYAQSRQKTEWLATTYTLPGNTFSGTFSAAELAQFEARRRAAMLLLAIEAHRLEHGELPQSLAELVGPYFDALPLDPYSGQEFRYFSAGLPFPESTLEAAELSEDRYWPPMSQRMSDVVAGKPCIWCTSSRLKANTWTVGELPDESRENAEPPKQVVYYTSRENPYSSAPLPPNIAWREGYWFPIPDERQ